MTVRLRKLALTIPTDGDLVERSAPGQAPTAFRIWAAGENRCDDGSVFFTPMSAELLIREQGDRGRLYAFDYDHLSLTSDRPATSGQAAGWHSLECRNDSAGNPELWAIDCDWCADAKAGLESSPPAWRYFSPAFRVTEAGEIVSYINCAICINPLTHDLPSLATLRAAAVTASTGDCGPMDKKALLAALATLANADASDEDKKAASSLLAAHLDAEDGDEDKKDDKKKEEADPPPPEDDKKDDDKKEEEKAAKALAATSKLAADYIRLKARVDATEISDLLTSRPDLDPTIIAWAQTQSLAVVKSFVAGASVKVDRPKAATQGDQKSNESGFVAAEMGSHPVDKVFGIRAASNGALGLGSLNREIGVRVLHSATPSEARKALAKKGA